MVQGPNHRPQINALSMQEAILRLQNYWAGVGCVLSQPFNTEVGAGTMNPATILRVLGPEPWSVAYVEPSVRPDDSRYGENPNRLQTHTQFQVVLKPEPGNPQELFLDSLRVLGIDLEKHDVRFVEDNWAQPAIGAWGLGWEVWLDGMEITQFTYFQQVGGQNLDPVPVEITYGLERILMSLQGVSHFKELQYAPGLSYGEIFGPFEYEMSRYYLDEANVDATRGLLAMYSDEARRMLDQRLPIPAHVFVLKSSHAFNVLDARGAISTTERAKWFATMRNQAREVSALWIELREEAGFPLGVFQPKALASLPASIESSGYVGVRDALLEIGVEELPPHVVRDSIAAVTDSITELLDATTLGHGAVMVDATPRRIIVRISNVEDSEPDSIETVRGPKVAAAYHDGTPTPALLGFMRKQGVEVENLVSIDVSGTSYVAVSEHRRGRSSAEVLTRVFSDLVASLRSDRNMRWNDPALTFSRPIRWLVALLGDAELTVAAGSLASGRATRLFRESVDSELTIAEARDFVDQLREHGIIANREDRRAYAVHQAMSLAESVNGTIDLQSEVTLIDEITDLVEAPLGVLGSFDKGYLDLPEEVLTTVMRKHQRYLPVRDDTGRLLPSFITMANGSHCDPNTVRVGNERVLRARFEDASFFWQADLEVPLDDFRARLAQLTFEESLGSMAERADRIAAVAEALADIVDLRDSLRPALSRAGSLAKFDLASQMVVELSSLAGIMAREYASRAGEPSGVVTALYEMELPRHQGDKLPTTEAGALLALADRFDLIVAMLSVGARLTGSSDPFGLRRAALGIVRILRNMPQLVAVTFEQGLEAAARQLRFTGHDVSTDVLVDARELLVARYTQRLRDEGAPAALVAGVLPLCGTPSLADRRQSEIQSAFDSNGPAFAGLVESVQRIVRIVPSGTSSVYDAALLVTPAEKALVRVVETLENSREATIEDWIKDAERLVQPLGQFFTDVMVLAEEPTLRAARLGLLQSILDTTPFGIDWVAIHSMRED